MSPPEVGEVLAVDRTEDAGEWPEASGFDCLVADAAAVDHRAVDAAVSPWSCTDQGASRPSGS